MTAKEESEAKAMLIGNWIFISATVWLIIGLVCFVGCGCEDDGDRTEIDDSINVPTNGTATITSLDINGNQNTTLVYVESSPGVTQVVEVDVNGNSNLVGVIYKQPVTPEAPAE